MVNCETPINCHFFQILETSDVPPGVVNIVTGESHELAEHLSRHDNVDGIWISGTNEECETYVKFLKNKATRCTFLLTLGRLAE